VGQPFQGAIVAKAKLLYTSMVCSKCGQKGHNARTCGKHVTVTTEIAIVPSIIVEETKILETSKEAKVHDITGFFSSSKCQPVIKETKILTTPSIMKFRMRKKCPYEEAPPIGYEYDLVYIHSGDFSECVGNEGTGLFHIIENDEIVGTVKGICYGSLQTIINTTSLKLMQLVHIGKLSVTKINKWGSHEFGFDYSIVGKPVLFDVPIYDSENTIKWNYNIKCLIDKYGWVKHISS
jgi:hypothetical protein